MLHDALAGNNDRVRVVFHHMPLSGRAWARAAAEGAACAQLQGSSVFWPLHDWLFENQEAITPDNIKQKLVEYARNSKEVDVKAFFCGAGNTARSRLSAGQTRG